MRPVQTDELGRPALALPRRCVPIVAFAGIAFRTPKLDRTETQLPYSRVTTSLPCMCGARRPMSHGLAPCAPPAQEGAANAASPNWPRWRRLPAGGGVLPVLQLNTERYARHATQLWTNAACTSDSELIGVNPFALRASLSRSTIWPPHIHHGHR